MGRVAWTGAAIKTPPASGGLLAGQLGESADGVMQPLYIRRCSVPSARAEGLAEKFAEVCGESKAGSAITHEAAGQL